MSVIIKSLAMSTQFRTLPPPPNIILKYFPCTVTTDKGRLADECRRSFALVLRVVYCGRVPLHVRP